MSQKQRVVPVAVETYSRAAWGGPGSCPESWCGVHGSKVLLGRVEGAAPLFVPRPSSPEYPAACAHCGEPVPASAVLTVEDLTVYRGSEDFEERVGLVGKPGSRFGLRPGDVVAAPPAPFRDLEPKKSARPGRRAR